MRESVLRTAGTSVARAALEPIIFHSYERALAADGQHRERLLARASRFRRICYPPAHPVHRIVHIPGGFRMWVNVAEQGGGDLYFGMPVEPIERKLMGELLRPGDTAFDIGANTGLYTLLAARAVGAHGRVHAFEPASTAYALLGKNVELNHLTNVVLNRLAVGDRRGTAQLYLNEESGLTGLGRTGRGSVIGAETVEIVTLDEYISSRQVPAVGILKVDVEGYEGHVLRGAEELIRREANLAIICELAEKNFGPLGHSVHDVAEWMYKHGYRAWEVRESNTGLLELSANQRPSGRGNVVFVKVGSAREQAIRRLAETFNS